MATPSLLHPRPVRELIAESPLVPVAIAVTLGLIADRYLGVPAIAELAFLAVGLIAAVALARRRPALTSPALWCVAAALAALYHHSYRNVYAEDDIGNLASETPKLVRLRGVLAEEPTRVRRPRPDGLATILRPDPTRTVLEVNAIRGEDGWLEVSGKAHVTVDGPLADYHLGDDVEVLGWLEAPQGPANPGGF